MLSEGCNICFGCLHNRLGGSLTQRHSKKTLKKLKKGLDKQDKVCYNKYVRGTGTLYKIKKWVATIAKCQRHRKEVNYEYQRNDYA